MADRNKVKFRFQGGKGDSSRTRARGGDKKAGCMSMTVWLLLLTAALWVGVVFFYWYSVNYSMDKVATDLESTTKYLRTIGSNIIVPTLGEQTDVGAPHTPQAALTEPTPPAQFADPQAAVQATTAGDQDANVNTGKKKKIAYAITVTKDGPFIDGALVLGYGVMKIHGGEAGTVYSGAIRQPPQSEYEAELVAFVTPEIKVASGILRQYGWRIVVKPLPVPLEEIRNQDYANKMRASGCCGADEFLKLWAYTLTEYHRVVHLDMDSVVFQSMDELYAIADKELLFTGDYNMQGKSPVPPVQGGFLVVKPSMDTFRRFQEVIREGDHRPGGGWGGSKIGNFWGGQTIQGILPYFYYSLAPGQSLELNRCEYNCMVDNPYFPKSDPPRCLDHQPTCQDCRLQVPEKVKSAHFTICQKPWTCSSHDNPRNMRLCAALHEQWFALRAEFERDILKVDAMAVYGTPSKGRYGGMCRGWGSEKYVKIPLPPGV